MNNKCKKWRDILYIWYTIYKYNIYIYIYFFLPKISKENFNAARTLFFHGSKLKKLSFSIVISQGWPSYPFGRFFPKIGSSCPFERNSWTRHEALRYYGTGPSFLLGNEHWIVIWRGISAFFLSHPNVRVVEDTAQTFLQAFQPKQTPVFKGWKEKVEAFSQSYIPSDK